MFWFSVILRVYLTFFILTQIATKEPAALQTRYLSNQSPTMSQDQSIKPCILLENIEAPKCNVIAHYPRPIGTRGFSTTSD